VTLAEQKLDARISDSYLVSLIFGSYSFTLLFAYTIYSNQVSKIFFFVLLWIEAKALHMLGKHSTT
jgi:hypothetical protein